MKALAFILICVSTLCAQRVEELVTAGDALDEKNRNSEALSLWNYELANFNSILKALAQAIYGKLPDASNEKAVEYFSKAIALQPRRVAHHLELGRAYLALGEKQKARAQFNKGLSLPSTEKDDDNNKQRARATLKELQ